MTLDYPGLVCECGCLDSDHFEQCGVVNCKNCGMYGITTTNEDIESYNIFVKTVQAWYKGMKFQCVIVNNV